MNFHRPRSSAHEEIERYFESEPKPGTPEGDRFDLLALVIEDYERKHWPIDPPDAVDGLRLVEQREAEDAGKLKALRAAARLGIGSLARSEFKEFRTIDDLQAYLTDLSDKVISGTNEYSRMARQHGASASALLRKSTLRIF